MGFFKKLGSVFKFVGKHSDKIADVASSGIEIYTNISNAKAQNSPSHIDVYDNNSNSDFSAKASVLERSIRDLEKKDITLTNEINEIKENLENCIKAYNEEFEKIKREQLIYQNNTDNKILLLSIIGAIGIIASILLAILL